MKSNEKSIRNIKTMRYMIEDLLTYSSDDIDTLISYYNIPTYTDKIYSLFDIAIHNMNKMNNMNNNANMINDANMMIKFRDNVSVDVVEYAENCLHEDEYTISENIGKGGYGSVYIAYKTDDDQEEKFVFKIQQIESYDSLNSFWKENYLHEELNRYNIGPELEEAWVCNYFYQIYHNERQTTSKTKIGISVQEAWDGDVYGLLTTDKVFQHKILPFSIFQKSINQSIMEKIKHSFETIIHQVLTMHRIGYVHRDLKLMNLLYKHTDDKFTFTVADFGLSERIHDIEKNTSKYQDSLKIYNFFKRYYYAVFDRKIRKEAFDLFPYSEKTDDPRNIDYVFLYIVAKQFSIIQNKTDFDRMVAESMSMDLEIDSPPSIQY